MEGYISTTELQDQLKITTHDYYRIKCRSGFPQEKECVKKARHTSTFFHSVCV